MLRIIPNGKYALPMITCGENGTLKLSIVNSVLGLSPSKETLEFVLGALTGIEA